MVACKVRGEDDGSAMGRPGREGSVVQVVRIPDGKGTTRVLYLREGCVVTHRHGARTRECVLRKLPDHDGRVLVEVDGKEERVAVAELVG